jgi:hypothetical protein
MRDWAQMVEWKPIKTMRKEQVEVLVYCHEPRPEKRILTAMKINGAWWPSSRGDLFEQYHGETATMNKPTHWMALPGSPYFGETS